MAQGERTRQIPFVVRFSNHEQQTLSSCYSSLVRTAAQVSGSWIPRSAAHVAYPAPMSVSRRRTRAKLNGGDVTGRCDIFSDILNRGSGVYDASQGQTNIQKPVFSSHYGSALARHWRERSRRYSSPYVDFAWRKHAYPRRRHRGAHDAGDRCRRGTKANRF